jgi:hypothetical protein
MQRKPLNVITLGQTESDNCNQIITISNFINYKVPYRRFLGTGSI